MKSMKTIALLLATKNKYYYWVKKGKIPLPHATLSLLFFKFNKFPSTASFSAQKNQVIFPFYTSLVVMIIILLLQTHPKNSTKYQQKTKNIQQN